MAVRRARVVLGQKETHKFKWDGGGWTEEKKRKSARYYECFRVGSLLVRLNDHVLIRNDDAPDSEAPGQCYVARIVEMYDNGSNDDDCHRAVVQWYSRLSDLSRYSTMFPIIPNSTEVVLDLRKHGFSKDIDAESVFALCEVEMVPVNYEIPKMTRNVVRAKFYVRWQFTGCDKTPILSSGLRTSGKSSQSRKSLFKSESLISTDLDRQNERSPRPPKSPVKNLMAQLFSPSKKNLRFSPSSSQIDSATRQIGDMVVSPHKCTTSEGIYPNRDSLVKKLTFDVPEESLTGSSHQYEPSDASPKYERQSIRLSVKGKKSYTNYYKEDFVCESQVKQANEKCNDSSKVRRKLGNKEGDDVSSMRRTTRQHTPNIRYKEENPVTTTRSTQKVTQKRSLTHSSETHSARRSEGKRTKLSSSKKLDSDSDDEWAPEDRTSTNRVKASNVGSVGRRTPSHTSSRGKKTTLSSSSRKATPVTARRNATPVVPLRNEPCYTPSNALEVARSRLHVSVIPDRLPCRQKEFEEIYSFVVEKLLDNTSGCMYISGVPGTGKTATVYEVIRCLTVGQESGEVPNFQFIAINGMKLTEPHQAYVQIVKELMNCKVTSEAAVTLLEKRFSRSAPRREPVVLLVDELDLLWTGRQDVLYNLFDWPARSQSKLVVVAIGNTMNLPEKIMMNRVVSRLGMTRMSFHAYTHKELKMIIMARIEELEAFMPDAVELVARKVASVSGDARRALDICRRAAEIAEFRSVTNSKRKKGMVGMDHVDAALQEMFLSPKVEAIKHASLLEKMALRAVLADFQQSGLEETSFSKMYCNLESLCCLEGITVPNASQAFAICSRLGACRLLLVEDGRKDIRQRIRMNVSTDDVHYALMSC